MAGLPPTRQQFFRHGPGPQVWEPLARRAADINATTNRILLPSHGANTDDVITLVPGADLTSPALPSGLSAFTPYYARVVSPSILELAASPGGAAIDFGTGESHGMMLEFDLGPAIDQALQNASSAFLACMAKNGWIEPAGGWGGDAQEHVMDLAAWPLLDSKGYTSGAEGGPKNDGYRIRWEYARKAQLAYCAGDLIPEGVIVPADESPVETLVTLGSSGWGDEDRGYGGRLSYADRRRPVV